MQAVAARDRDHVSIAVAHRARARVRGLGAAGVSDWLSEMRSSYEPGHFDLDDLEPTWLAQMEAWIGEASARKLPEPNAMVLATASADGWPAARTVLLKGLDERGLVFFTNLESRKGRELAENPRASVAFTWLELQRQVRADGAVERGERRGVGRLLRLAPARVEAGRAGQPAVAGGGEPRRAREGATPSWPSATPRAATCRGPTGGAACGWCPQEVEFWQGHPDRLHDRLRFRHTVGEWVVERLAP